MLRGVSLPKPFRAYRYMSCLVVGLLVACTDPAATDFGAAGHHPIGYQTLDVQYTTPAGEDRDLVVHAWYPAEEVEGEHPRYAFVRSARAVANAPALPGPFPTLVYSHGHLGLPDASTFLMEHFASHGWLVLSPRHTGNTTADPGMRRTEIYYLRSMDVVETLNAAEALASPHPLQGLVGDPAVISGHSFGGYTAFALAGATFAVDEITAACDSGEQSESVCGELDEDALAIFAAGLGDSRFAAAIVMAPGNFDLFGADGIADIGIPVLQLEGSDDGNPIGEPDQIFDALDGPDDLRLNLEGAGHQSFTDICDPFPRFMGCSSVNETEDEQAIIRAYALGFAAAHVQSNADARRFVEGSASDRRIHLRRTP